MIFSLLYSPTRASAGSPIRDLQPGREVAFLLYQAFLPRYLGIFPAALWAALVGDFACRVLLAWLFTQAVAKAKDSTPGAPHKEMDKGGHGKKEGGCARTRAGSGGGADEERQNRNMSQSNERRRSHDHRSRGRRSQQEAMGRSDGDRQDSSSLASFLAELFFARFLLRPAVSSSASSSSSSTKGSPFFRCRAPT